MTENNNSTSFRSGSVSAVRRNKLLIGRQSVGPNNAFLRGLYNYEKEKAQLTAAQSEFAVDTFYMIIAAKIEHLLEGSVFERVKSTSKNSAFWFMRLKKDLQEIEYKELSEQQHQEFNIKAPGQGIETGNVAFLRVQRKRTNQRAPSRLFSHTCTHVTRSRTQNTYHVLNIVILTQCEWKISVILPKEHRVAPVLAQDSEVRCPKVILEDHIRCASHLLFTCAHPLISASTHRFVFELEPDRFWWCSK